MYYITVDGDLKVILAAHVDDLIWVCEEGYEEAVEKVLGCFELKKIEEGKFRFCGREYEQLEDFSVKVTCKDNTEKILPINFKKAGRRLDDKATEGEIAQMRSVVGSLAWISRQVRPEMCYHTSKMQSVVGSAQVKHLVAANKILQHCISTSSRGLLFKSGLFDWNEKIVVTITDASWAGEKLIVDDKVFPRRSQYGRINCLGNASLWDTKEGGVHIIGWKSALIKRQCRSTR